MAFKVSSTRLIKITKLLDRCDKALNVLERNNKNKIVYPELKKDVQEMSDLLKTVYELESFEEWKTKN